MQFDDYRTQFIVEEQGAFVSQETPAPDPRPKTIFCDIDGVLVWHMGSLDSIWGAANLDEAPVIPGVKARLREWERRGYNIILTTGRKEPLREATVRQLRNLGIIYDQLVMGIGGGERHLINDLKPGSTRPTAYAHNLPRNAGLGSVEI